MSKRSWRVGLAIKKTDSPSLRLGLPNLVACLVTVLWACLTVAAEAAAPSITRVNPSGTNVTVAPSQSITFQVNCSDSDGNLKEVDWYVNGVYDQPTPVSGSAGSASWSRSFGTGTTTVTAVVKDLTSLTNALVWNVTGTNQAPTITRVAPSGTNVTVAPSQSITFQVNCSDSDGNLKEVDWYVNGVYDQATPVSGSAGSASWSRSFGTGTTTVTAVVKDLTSLTNALVWNVTGTNQAPTITRVAPSGTNVTVAPGQSITFQVNCSDSDGNLKEVDWYVNGVYDQATPVSGSAGSASWSRSFSTGTTTIMAVVKDLTSLTNALVWNVTGTNQAPTITRVAPSGTNITAAPGQSIIFQVGCSDSDGNLKEVDWYVNGVYDQATPVSGSAGSASWSRSFSTGTTAIMAVVKDLTSLTNALVWNVSVTNQAPTITRVAPSGTNITAAPGQSITFQVGCSDSDGNLKEVDWYVNGVYDQATPVTGSAGSASWSRSFSTGTTTIMAVVVDMLSLTNALVWNVSVTNQAPTITRVAPSGTNITAAPGQSITFQVGCSDSDGNLKEVDWYVNGVYDQATPVTGSAGSASWSRSFSTGTTTIMAVVVDMLSLTNALVWNVSVTNQAPTITRVAPSGTNITAAPGQSITFQVGCSDSDGNLKEVDWYVNGVYDQATPVTGSAGSASWSRSFSTGTTTIMAVVVDMLSLTNALVWNVSVTNQAPTITRVAPSGTNITAAPGQSITFQVNCSDSDGNLKEVDWYVNGVYDQATPVSGSTNNASWSRSFSTGTTTIMAVVVDMLSLTNALVWNVSVTNQAPTITRVAPSGTNITAAPGQSITFQVNCSDSDGNLKEVDWYVNGVYDQATPVSGSTNNASWSRSFSTGNTTIMAVVVDMLSLTNALVWNVSGTNQAPTITRVAPSGTNITAAPGQSITFQVGCSDSDGNLKEVDWYVNGVYDQATPVSGSTNNASWSRSFSTGNTTIMAVVVDMLSLTNALVWNVSVTNQAPTITRVAPSGTNITAAPGQSITFQVNCSDSDGNLKEVDWYVNGVYDQATPVSGSAGSASWSRSFSTGTTAIMAVVVDMLSLTNTLVWNVSVTNQAPTITRVAPSGTNITAAPGQSITFQVNCSDLDGNLKEVDWYVNGVYDQATPVSGSAGSASWSRSFSTGTTAIMAVVVDMLSLTNALVWNVSAGILAPSLTVRGEGANVVLSWPTNDSAFQLVSANNPAATNWNPVSIAPVIVNGQNTVTNSAVGAAKFYRLKK